ncbi:hypothetical protein [Blautia obeum]|uniref:hypothetical protein n=1 Tax=Blautia obeum TaxID=40520 RepID=UPI00319DB081
MKGKILCPAGCQNPVSRITKAKENLKSPRSAGSWRPFKCIFGERKKGRAQRAESPAPFALCTENPDRDSLRLTESKILPQYQNSLFAHFAPAGILLGSAFPKPCLCGLRRLKIPQNIFSDFSKTVPLHTPFFSY